MKKGWFSLRGCVYEHIIIKSEIGTSVRRDDNDEVILFHTSSSQLN